MRNTFEQLFDEYYDRIFVYILFRVKNPHDAEDLTADVFMKAFAAPHNPEIAKFSTYVYAIAANVLKNYYRSTAKIRSVFSSEEPDGGFTVEADALDDLITSEEYEGLKQALAALPERQYEVVYRRYYLEQPFKEIGAALGISEDYSKKIHKRALEKLKKLDNVSLFANSNVQLNRRRKT